MVLYNIKLQMVLYNIKYVKQIISLYFKQINFFMILYDTENLC